MHVPGRVVKRMVAAPWVHPKTGTLYYRKVVPERARHLFGGNREVRRSLKTRNMAEARLRHAQIAADVEARIAAASIPAHRKKSSSGRDTSSSGGPPSH